MTSPPPLRDGEPILTGLLYRRIPTDGAHWVAQEGRPSTQNFEPSKHQGHLSMQLGAVSPPEEILANFPNAGLLEIDASAFVSRGLRVTYTPAEGRGHVAVWGLENAKKPLLRELCAEIRRAWEPGTQQLVLDRTPQRR